MYELLNYNMTGSKNYPDHFLWTPDLFSECGTNTTQISNVVSESLSGLIKINNIASSEVRTNNSTNGLDIRYGKTTIVSSLFTPSQLLIDQALLKYGSISKPTLISIDITAKFAVNQRECFHIFAITNSGFYSLFNIYQGTVDGNYGFGSNGIWYNNAKTKIKSLSSTTTYSGTLLLSSMPNCFIAGETSCDIAIVRLQSNYWEGTNRGMRNASTLYIKKLEIN